jgi:putative tryptophan/tyrosine transport system substrate-binding protein
MKAKILVYALPALILAGIHLADAQQPKRVPRIGFLVDGTPSTHSTRIEAFREGLRELGYVEEKNITIEYRYAAGMADRLSDLVTELVSLKVDVIMTGGTPAVLAAKKATKTIPIVFASVGNPVGIGIVDSLAQPGANVTGLSSFTGDLSGKRLELLKEAFPKVSRVAVLWYPSNASSAIGWREIQATAPSLGVQLQSVEVRVSNDFDSAFKAVIRERAQALLTHSGSLANNYKARILDFAATNRLPAMYADTEFTPAGGLMSYGPSYADMNRRAATYVDKILKGTKPADLPVEQPTKFEFIINLKTAKQIGMTIPPNVLARADKVIR